MAFWLLSVLVISAFFVRACLRGPVSVGKLRWYAGGVSSVLAVMLAIHLGLGKSGSPVIPKRELLHLQHRGYYTSVEGAFVFKGDPTKIGEKVHYGFQHRALAPGEMIQAVPLGWDETHLVTGWRVEAHVGAQPLRIDGECRNVPAEHWLRPGDAVTIVVDDKDGKSRFVSLRWTASRSFWSFWRRSEAFWYDQGDWENGVLTSDSRVPGGLRLSRVLLRNGLRLADMFRFSTRLARDWPKAARAGHARLETTRSEFWAAISAITLVRQQKGKTDSLIGVLLAAPDNRIERTRVCKNDRLLSFPEPGRASLFAFSVPADAVLAYGLKDDLRLAVRLPARSTYDRSFRYLLVAPLVCPESWPLPPDQDLGRFILTASNEYIPIPGYVLNVGNEYHPFYALGSIAALSRFTINDGKHVSVLAVDEEARLGDFEQGVTLALASAAAPIPYLGLKAILVLLLVTVGFWLVTGTVRPGLARNATLPDGICALTWGIGLAIVAVRLILAYRVSLLPPDDVTQVQISDVFRNSLRVSFICFWVIPISFLIAWWLGGRDRIAAVGQRLWTQYWVRWRPAWWLWLVPSGLPFLAGLAKTESLFSIRVSIATHVLMLFSLALTARLALEAERLRSRLLYLLAYVALPLVLLAVWVGDTGSLIYVFSFFLTAVTLFYWEHQTGRTRSFALAGAVAMVVLVALVPVATQAVGISMVQKVVDLSSGVVPHQGARDWLRRTVREKSQVSYYRLTSFRQRESELLLRSAEGSNIEPDLLLRNAHQRWQMLLYAAEGRYQPRGYGCAPLSRVGITYGTSVADTVFAIYLLAEHGPVTAWLVLVLYACLASVLLYGAAIQPHQNRHRTLALTAIGGFFACNALYMASANLGLAPFTGQNLPLLSLGSKADLFQGTALLVLAGLLLRSGVSASGQAIIPGHRSVRNIGIAAVALLGMWLAVIGYRLWALPPEYRASFGLKPGVIEILRDHLPAPNARGQRLELRDDGTIRAGKYVSDLTEIEQLAIKQFNERANKLDPYGGLYYIEAPNLATGSSGRGPRLRVNERYFFVPSPFRHPRMWEGRILATGARNPGPTVAVLGRPFTLSLAKSGYPESVSLTTNTAVVGNQSVQLRESDRGRSPIYCELERDEETSGMILEPKHSSNWQVYVNGKPAALRQRLTPYKVVVIEGPRNEHGRPFRHNLLYLGVESPVLAFVQWRNGDLRRVFPQGRLFALAYSIGKAADEIEEVGGTVPDTLHLSLDVELQRRLQQAIEQWAAARPAYRRNDPLLGKRVAVTVLDAFTGEVLALPSWPYGDPNSPEFEEALIRLSTQDQVRLLANHNLSNHAVGSTIKPLVFSTVVSQYWPSGRDLGRLVVHSQGTVHSSVGGVRFEPDYKCPGTGAMNMREFLVHSYDWPECLVGFLGLVRTPQQWGLVCKQGQAQADLVLGGRSHSFRLKGLPPHDFPFTEEPFPRPRTEAMEQTLLFRGLAQLFNVGVSQNPKDIRTEYGRQFIPSLTTHSGLSSGDLLDITHLDNVLPEPVNFCARDYQNVRQDLVTFLIGGRICGVNNVIMAESAARLATGRKVAAVLERRTAPAEPQPMPMPLSHDGWRRDHLLDPLREVGIRGTMRQAHVRVGSGYVVHFKTGTITEKEGRPDSEMLLFIVGEASNGKLVRGRTLAGYAYLEESKRGGFAKYGFAQRVIPEVAKYLERQEK